MPDTKYCYPDTDILINKLDIRDLDKLHIFERKLTMLRLLELLDKPINGKFDFKHLQAIHAYIFQDVYDWAGKVRTVDIAKGNMFCNVRFISSQADVIFSGLKEEHYLAGLDEDMFIKRLAYYFSEINALHPFREGNGRSQREFIRSLALKNGYLIYFDRVSEEEMLLASQKSFLCDYEDMEKDYSKMYQEKVNMEQGIRPIGELLTDRGECQYFQPEGHSGELLSVTRMAGGGCVSGWSPVQQFASRF